MTRKHWIFIICAAALAAVLVGSFTWVTESSAKSRGRHAFFWRQMMGEEGHPLLRQLFFGRMKNRIAGTIDIQYVMYGDRLITG